MRWNQCWTCDGSAAVVTELLAACVACVWLFAGPAPTETVPLPPWGEVLHAEAPVDVLTPTVEEPTSPPPTEHTPEAAVDEPAPAAPSPLDASQVEQSALAVESEVQSIPPSEAAPVPLQNEPPPVNASQEIAALLPEAKREEILALERQLHEGQVRVRFDDSELNGDERAHLRAAWLVRPEKGPLIMLNRSGQRLTAIPASTRNLVCSSLPSQAPAVILRSIESHLGQFPKVQITCLLEDDFALQILRVVAQRLSATQPAPGTCVELRLTINESRLLKVEFLALVPPAK